MLLSEICRRRNEDLWKETVEHPFLKEMAYGVLPEEKFRYYMLQDYFYLLRYMDIFSTMFYKAETLLEKQFISDNIEAILAEIKCVHIPNMNRFSISDRDIKESVPHIDVLSYTNYMREVVEKGHYLSGFIAILNCSWSYEFLAQEWIKRCPDKIDKSLYKDWFFSYASGDYVNTNARLCEKVDDLSKGLSDMEKKAFAEVFHNCALYEYRLWDMFYTLGKNTVRKEITDGMY